MPRIASQSRSRSRATRRSPKPAKSIQRATPEAKRPLPAKSDPPGGRGAPSPRPAQRPGGRRRVVAYVRVSTREQGISGLGLEAQCAEVRRWAEQHDVEIAAVFTDVESGRRDDRPELLRALNHCKLFGASLIVSKLDRLGRRVAFIARLMDSGVELIVANNPQVTRLTLHILAAVAEEESRAVRERTRAALQAYRERGGKLGSARPGHWKGREHLRLAGLQRGREAAANAIRVKADEFCRSLAPRILSLRGEGLTPQQIAERLNAEGYPTQRNKQWGRLGVERILERYEKIGA